MNYRFRVSERSGNHRGLPVPAHSPRRYRLRGRTTLRPLHGTPHPLLWPIFWDQPLLSAGKKRRRRYVRRGLCRLGHALVALGRMLKEGFAFWGALLRPKRPSRGGLSLSLLSGALCAALLVSGCSAGALLLYFFAPYHRAYTPRIVPDFVGSTPEEVLLSEDAPWNLILTYAEHESIPEGEVISQTPPAGVVRRVYHKNSPPTVSLTVSRGRASYSLEELSGLPLREARLILENHGIAVTLREEASPSAGIVLGTLPPAGSLLRRGDRLVLRIGAGETLPMVPTPSLSGLSEGNAAARLTAHGLKVGQVTYAASGHPAGTVIAQSPAPHTDVAGGTAVSYTVSAGNSILLKTLPDLCGLTRAEAAARLRQVGLVVGTVYALESAAPQGRVLSQEPPAGTVITSSTVSVDLYLSK